LEAQETFLIIINVEKSCQVKSSQIYLYSAFHNTDCIKAASQYQSKQLNSACLLLEKDIQVW